MEELLSITKKQGGKYAGTITVQRKKTFAIVLGTTANVFANAQANTPKDNLYQDVLS